MFHFPLRLLALLVIASFVTKSLLVHPSFDDTCSDQLSCVPPLICSANTSRCHCSDPTSVWDSAKADCFYCLPGWIDGPEQRCLSLSVPSQGGLSYEKADDVCSLLHFSNRMEFERFQLKIQNLLNSSYSSAVTLFFRLGAWIDHSKFLLLHCSLHSTWLIWRIVPPSDHLWCDKSIDTMSPSSCIAIQRQSGSNGSLCLIQAPCEEEKLFICDGKFQITPSYPWLPLFHGFSTSLLWNGKSDQSQ